MIDIHAHILPGIDDGAADMNHALEMTALAVESGVTILVATPHSSAYGHRKNHWDQELMQRVLAFRAALEKEKIPLKIAPGMEIFGTEEVPALLKQRKMIGLNGSNYPLIEFAFTNYAAKATEILEEVLALGMRPVIAHPERYDYVQRDPSLLNLWVEMGCLLQINKGSLQGSFGRNEKYLALELLKRNFVFAVASDAHSPSVRTTWMRDIETMLKEDFSEDIANKLLYSNPLKLLKNETIHEVKPHWFR